jgi:hypothetical protein
MKTYSANGIVFNYIGGRNWKFSSEAHKFSKIVKCGGAVMAEKVAKQVAGGLKRTAGNGLDGLARKSIDAIAALNFGS